MLAMTEGAGGLFDFDATLPLMGIQFVLLMVVLTFIFYTPVSKFLDERERYILQNLAQASDKFIKASELYKQYEEQLQEARSDADKKITWAQKDAKDRVTREVSEARRDTAKLLERRRTELETQRSLALQQLETQIDELSDLIQDKLLGKEVVPF